MAQGVRSGKKAMIDERIKKFCVSSEELLTGIHQKYDNTNGKRPKQKRRGRKRKEEEVLGAEAIVNLDIHADMEMGFDMDVDE